MHSLTPQQRKEPDPEEMSRLDELEAVFRLDAEVEQRPPLDPPGEGRVLTEESERGKILQAARLYAIRRSQKDVADRLNLTASTVSRLIERAWDEGYLDLRVRVSPTHLYQEKLRQHLFPRGVRETWVVPDGPEKNVENLAPFAAKVLMKAIANVARRKGSNGTINIVVACGSTVLRVIEEVIDLLEIYCETNNVIPKEICIYPSTLYNDSELKTIFPHTTATLFWGLCKKKIADKINVRAFAPTLPLDFYDPEHSDDEREAIKEKYGFNAIMESARRADIVVSGSGTVADADYEQIARNLGETITSLDRENTPEVLYRPIGEDGEPIEGDIARKLVGLTIDELCTIAADPLRYVIVISGGERKARSLLSILEKPMFNTLITDVSVARLALAPARSQ